MDWSNAKKYGPLRGIAGEIHGDNSQCQHRGYAVECMKQKKQELQADMVPCPSVGNFLPDTGLGIATHLLKFRLLDFNNHIN